MHAGSQNRYLAARSILARMPLVHVSRRVGRSREENARVLEGIHEAIVEAFKTPESDRTQILNELDAAHFEIPATARPRTR